MTSPILRNQELMGQSLRPRASHFKTDPMRLSARSYYAVIHQKQLNYLKTSYSSYGPTNNSGLFPPLYC